MKQEIEIEFKNLLTKKEYNQMLHNYPFPTNAKEQINYYFETDTFTLKEHQCALRIREKDGKFTMTLKEPHSKGLLETHVSLTKQEAMQCIIDNKFVKKDEMNNRLLQMGITADELTYYGSLTTKRREYKSNGTLFVLDYSEYNGNDDYEFELEATDYKLGNRIFMDTLQKSNIEIKETPAKIERFFATLLYD